MTLKIRDKLNEFNCDVHNAMAGDYIPQHMHEGITHYIENHESPGSFLTCVLENDLKGAVGNADAMNRTQLPAYISFLTMYAPMACWGSPNKVTAWLHYSPKDNK